MTHVLNAAEFRGVNIGESDFLSMLMIVFAGKDYFAGTIMIIVIITTKIIIIMIISMIVFAGEDYFAGTSIKYQGLRVEDTPQTQICRCQLQIAVKGGWLTPTVSLTVFYTIP